MTMMLKILMTDTFLKPLKSEWEGNPQAVLNNQLTLLDKTNTIFPFKASQSLKPG